MILIEIKMSTYIIILMTYFSKFIAIISREMKKTKIRVISASVLEVIQNLLIMKMMIILKTSNRLLLKRKIIYIKIIASKKVPKDV